MVHGVLVVDKPAGKTSHDLVSWCRRLLGQKRIGHTGTLDPAATGVLPLCLGEATRLAEYLTGQDKVYAAEVLLGYASNTYDLDGEVRPSGPKGFTLSRHALESALLGFQGIILQRPPLYSAISKDGKRLYQLARAGVEVEVSERRVEIRRIEILEAPGEIVLGSRIRLLVECGKGTYLRSLAHDLGQLLGCGALLSNLRRLSSGAFSLGDAHTVAQAETVALSGATAVQELLVPLTISHLGLPWLRLEPKEEADVGFGRAFTVAEGRIRGAVDSLLQSDDVLLMTGAGLRALARYQAKIGVEGQNMDRLTEGVLRPHKVFAHPIAMSPVSYEVEGVHQ